MFTLQSMNWHTNRHDILFSNNWKNYFDQLILVISMTALNTPAVLSQDSESTNKVEFYFNKILGHPSFQGR